MYVCTYICILSVWRHQYSCKTYGISDRCSCTFVLNGAAFILLEGSTDRHANFTIRQCTMQYSVYVHIQRYALCVDCKEAAEEMGIQEFKAE